MRRRLFNFVAAVSLLVCVAALSLWIRGAVGPVRYERQAWHEAARTFRTEYSISLYGGVVRVGVIRYERDVPLTSSELARAKDTESRLMRLAPPATARAGSRVNDDVMLYRFQSNATQLPQSRVLQSVLRFRPWPVAVLAAVMPAVWLVRKIRTARRVRMGHCLSCGYDMRATPDRCPECGAVPAADRNKVNAI